MIMGLNILKCHSSSKIYLNYGIFCDIFRTILKNKSLNIDVAPVTPPIIPYCVIVYIYDLNV